MSRKNILLEFNCDNDSNARNLNISFLNFITTFKDKEIPSDVKFDTVSSKYTLVIRGHGGGGEVLRRFPEAGEKNLVDIHDIVNWELFAKYQSDNSNMGRMLRKVDTIVMLVCGAGSSVEKWDRQTPINYYVAGDKSLKSRKIIAPKYLCSNDGPMVISASKDKKTSATRYDITNIVNVNSVVISNLEKDPAWVVFESPEVSGRFNSETFEYEFAEV